MKNEQSDPNKKEALSASESDKDAVDVLLNKATDSFKWWNNLATFNQEDALVMTLFKISVRVVGVVLMILLSPFALVALIVAFMAAL